MQHQPLPGRRSLRRRSRYPLRLRRRWRRRWPPAGSAEGEALDVVEVAVAPLAGDDLALGVDLGGAPLLGVDGLVGGAAEVRLALEGEREHAARRLLLARRLRVDETELVS